MQLLVAEAQLLSHPVNSQLSAPSINLMDFDPPSANGNGPEALTPDPDESALRQAFASLLADTGNLWQHANSTLRSLHRERLEAGLAQPEVTAANGLITSAPRGEGALSPASGVQQQLQPHSQAPLSRGPAQGSPQHRQQMPQQRVNLSQRLHQQQQAAARNPFANQQSNGSPRPAGSDAASRFLGRIMGAPQADKGALSNGPRQGSVSEDGTASVRPAAADLLAGGLNRFSNFTRSFTQREGQGS